METKGHAYFMIEEVNSYPINIYTISPVSLFGCVIYFGPKFQIILNCLIARQRYHRKIISPMYLLLAI